MAPPCFVEMRAAGQNSGGMSSPYSNLGARQDDTFEKGGLPGVLGVVVDHADEPYTQRNQRVPSFVHDGVEVGVP
jgi:hypothetical protein